MSSNQPGNLEADTLSSLKSTFTFSRRPRPPTGTPNHSERVPLGKGVKKIARRGSKGGLRNIFTRTKADPELSHVFIPVMEESVQRSPLSRRSLPVTGEADDELETSIQRSYTKSISATPENKRSDRGLRLGMRSRTTKADPTPKSNVKPTPKSSPRAPRRTLAAWDPPPLFQAYPQAIKHAQLSSSTLSADSILRMSNHRRGSSIREEITQAGLVGDEPQTPAAKKTEKARNKHRRQISGSKSKVEWTQKIYVLVTSGYLLQYSGEGSFDRLPEKMMQLGKDSVAFASDVIPGKHWVLQISQAMDTDGTPAPDARSLLSRLAFRGADYRRTATSLLLILNSAEELESWITTVRREIEALGGKKYVSETGKPKVDDEVVQLKAHESQRYLVQRDPDRFSNPPTPSALSFNTPVWRQSVDYHEPPTPEFQSRSVIGPSSERLSVATSSASHDGQQLDSLRDNSFRFSYISSGQRTFVTSESSTPTCSPTQETFVIVNESRPSKSVEEARPRPNASAISERRRSMQTMKNPAFELHTAPKAIHSRPHSTYGGPGRGASIQSPSTPNFSVPTSKRYTLVRRPDIVEPTPQIQVKTPGRVLEASMKGNRKSPPAPLKGRPLSPVLDQNSPVKQIPVYTPTKTSLEKVMQHRASIVEIRPRSSNDSPNKNSTTIVESPLPMRRFSLTPPKPPKIVHTTLQ